jgi:N-acetyl-anhydromuramyl-L-alanine amidase AmpD
MPFTERRRSTPNVSTRRNKMRGVVFHHTAGSYAGAVAWLCDPKAKASAHVVIAKTGERTVLAADSSVTWHAGRSFWDGTSAVNDCTLGIEFELTADDVERGVPLTQAQLDSAIEYLAPRIQSYGWKRGASFTHHRAICIPRGRKRDLSDANWRLVEQALDRHFETLCARPATPRS